MRKITEIPEIQQYWENGYQALGSSEKVIVKILNFVHDHQIEAPTLYRGIYMNPDNIEVGDTIELHDQEPFFSMSPDFSYARSFGNCVFKVEGLSGYPLQGKEDKEWIVINTEIYIDEIEHDEDNDIYIFSCR